MSLKDRARLLAREFWEEFKDVPLALKIACLLLLVDYWLQVWWRV